MKRFLKVTYYDNDYKGERTIIAKEIRRIRPFGFPKLYIITLNNNNNIIIDPSNLIEVNNKDK